MFHVPAHKYVGSNPPAQFTITEGRKRQVVSEYQPLSLVFAGRRFDFALHEVAGFHQVTDPQSGLRIVRVYQRDGRDVVADAREMVRNFVMRVGDAEFRERIDKAREEAQRTRHNLLVTV
jgi:hypothetical protein